MFQKACKFYLNAMSPIVLAARTEEGQLYCMIGAGLIINAEGWLVTAGHILDQLREWDRQRADHHSFPNRNRRKVDRVTHFAVLVGQTGATIKEIGGNRQLDLGVAKLEGFNPAPNHKFPKFRTREAEQGELLCRLGYPFVDEIKPFWSKRDGFSIDNLFPVPQFANEALVSRFAADARDGRVIWIETSTPGLKGQSGGPLVDTGGLICGIQVNTEHFPLGFEGRGDDPYLKNQFLHSGRAVPAARVCEFLDLHGIPYHKEDNA